MYSEDKFKCTILKFVSVQLRIYHSQHGINIFYSCSHADLNRTPVVDWEERISKDTSELLLFPRVLARKPFDLKPAKSVPLFLFSLCH